MNHRIFHNIGKHSHHLLNHTIVLILVAIGAWVTSFIHPFLPYWYAGTMFYVSREIAQWEIRKGKFEWADVLVPAIITLGLVLLL
jgi:hypothetical protein